MPRHATETTNDLTACLINVEKEVLHASMKHPPMHSLHEALGVIREEYIEFEEEVFKKAENRRPQDVAMELRQIAAMAVRAAVDLGYVE